MKRWQKTTINVRNGKQEKARTDGEVWQIQEEKVLYGPYYTPMKDFIAQLQSASKGMVDVDVKGVGGKHRDGTVELWITGWREVNEDEKQFLPSKA